MNSFHAGKMHGMMIDLYEEVCDFVYRYRLHDDEYYAPDKKKTGTGMSKEIILQDVITTLPRRKLNPHTKEISQQSEWKLNKLSVLGDKQCNWRSLYEVFRDRTLLGAHSPCGYVLGLARQSIHPQFWRYFCHVPGARSQRLQRQSEDHRWHMAAV